VEVHRVHAGEIEGHAARRVGRAKRRGRYERLKCKVAGAIALRIKHLATCVAPSAVLVIGVCIIRKLETVLLPGRDLEILEAYVQFLPAKS